MGHSRSIQGRHHTGLVTISAGTPACARGEVARSLVGPKMPTIGTPTAAARCIAPESFDTHVDARLRTAARTGRLVAPARSRTYGRASAGTAARTARGGAAAPRPRADRESPRLNTSHPT